MKAMTISGINTAFFAVKQYMTALTSKKADKMDASIKGILGEKLASHGFDGAQRLFTLPNRVNFVGLRKEKTALFLNVSDTGRSMDRLVSLFYVQAM